MSIQYHLDGEVAIISLARPEKFNAVSAELSRDLVEAISRSGTEARAMVLTGQGKAFCAGADLGDLMADYEDGGPDLASVLDQRFNPMVRALVAVPIPTVAAVNGVAAGAGLGLALACDLRVMSADAFLLSAFISLALIPDTGLTWLLVRHLGLSRALEFTATNRRLPAAEAAALGLARVSEPGEVLAAATGLASELAAGPVAVHAVNRRLLYAGAASDLSAALELEKETQGELGKDALHLEGMSAFLAKRSPDFRSV